MEGLSVPANSPAQQSSFSGTIRYTHYQADIVVIQATLSSDSSGDTSNTAINNLSKGLSIMAQEIIDKLNERLKADLPDGIQSLKPEDVTPEATADRIVKSVTALFDAYAKQNPDLDSEELLKSFMEEVRKGVDQGYGEAFDILEGLGAFNFEGVKEGIEKTKSLIEEKLKAFESQKRQDLGLEPKVDAQQVRDFTKNEILKQAGAGVNLSLVA